jgi:hypothetical protein
MKLQIRDKIVNLDDELEVNFATEYFFWDEYNRIKNSATNISGKKDLANYYNALQEKYTNGGLEHSRKFIETPDDFFEWISEDKCFGKSKNFGSKENLIIYICSHAGIENRMNLPILSMPNRIKDLNDRFDVLTINEHPLRFPESQYPSYLVLGCSDIHNTFEKMCNYISTLIDKKYKKVVVFGDSKHAAISLSIAHALDDIVTNVFIAHGQTSYDWEESGWIQSYIKYITKRNKIYENTGYLDDKMLNDISGPHIFHILKCYKFKKLNIKNEILSPFKYHKNYKNIDVAYFYNKNDLEYKPFIDWLLKNATGSITFNDIDYDNKVNQHFIKPYLERKIIPDYINKVILNDTN